MKIAPRTLAPPAGGYRPTKDAWTAFWQDPGQSRCVAGAPDIWQSLTRHWTAFALSLASGTRVLDLGCGAGAVARVLIAARRDVHVTGIDFARIPLTICPQVELLSDTAMESLPFAEQSFGAVVSQFGYEYSQTGAAAREMTQVVAPDARFSFLVHHAESAIVATNRSRLHAIVAFLEPSVRAAFCSGDVAGLNAQLAALRETHPHDTLIAELARALPSRLGRAQSERIAIWNAIEDALAPERCLADSLNACCVASLELDEWLGPLRSVCELEPVAVLREPNGDPIAWKIEGARRPVSG
jgi:SAM-dependent methyltransferase